MMCFLVCVHFFRVGVKKGYLGLELADRKFVLVGNLKDFFHFISSFHNHSYTYLDTEKL